MNPYLLTFYGGLISVLLAIVGYFLNKQVTVTETLTKAVNALNITVVLLQNNQTNFVANYEEKQATTESQVIAHSQKLHDHEISIVKLQGEVAAINREK